MMKNVLQPFANQIVAYAEEEKDIVDQAILLWRIIYSQVRHYQRAHPDWIYIRHEDILSGAA